MPSQIFVPNTELDGNNLDFNWSNQTLKALVFLLIFYSSIFWNEDEYTLSTQKNIPNITIYIRNKYSINSYE